MEAFDQLEAAYRLHTQTAFGHLPVDDAADLIERLVTTAAMIMENTSELALIRHQDERLAARIEAVVQARKDIESLTNAAEAVRRRWVHCRTADSV